MSATIYARQVKPCDGESLSTSSPSWFIDIMKQGFYDFPVILTAQHIPKLEGMAATMVNSKGNPFQELIDLIEKWETVEVYAVY